jgi:hypothetical protein
LAPLYAADNLSAGRIAGPPSVFAKQSWPDDTPARSSAMGDPSDAVTLRAKGILEALIRASRCPANLLDTGGQPPRGGSLLTKYLAQQPRRKVLVATLDVRLRCRPRLPSRWPSDKRLRHRQPGLIASIQRIRREKGSTLQSRGVVLGSVAYYLDRYGYESPLARM